jgi:hypothetical protein
MLPQKQTCLARNRIGMTCQCPALANGRCHFHSPVLAGASERSVTSRIVESVSALSGALANLPDRLVPARAYRQTPVAFSLRAHSA